MTKILTAEEILRRYKAGLSLSQIGKIEGKSSDMMAYRLRRLDPTWARKARRWRRPMREALLLYAQGRTLRQVAKVVGVDHSTLAYWFRKMHPRYTQIVRRGVFASTADFLASREARRSPEKANQVRRWFLDNLPTIMETEATTDLVTYGKQAERCQQYKEVGYRDELRQISTII